MALVDYRLCDVCDGKVFYDANLSYDNPQTEEERKRGYKLGYLGDWAVICADCAVTHKCVVIEKERVK